MDEYYQPQVEKKALDDAYSRYNSASKQNYEINKEHRTILGKFYEHIALYSAGAISFSTTLVGLVLANYHLSLAQTVLFFPNIYYLYACWFFFALAFIASLLSKKYDAFYISAFGMSRYTERYREYEEVQLELLEVNKDDILFTRGGEWQEQTQVKRDNIDKLKTAHGSNKKRSDIYWVIVRICYTTAQIGATLGLILLLLFSVLLTQSVVFGNTKPTTESNTDKMAQTTALQLEDKAVIVSGVNNEEKGQVQKEVGTFEDYLYAKDVTSALSMFTPPATKNEQNDLDFLLGKDLTQDATKPLPRLFSTQGYNYTVSGHLIREIRKSNGNINVSVDELRTVYSGGEYVGYVTKVDSLIFELKSVDSGYKIDRYYHSKPTGKALKYEGFIAE